MYKRQSLSYSDGDIHRSGSNKFARIEACGRQCRGPVVGQVNPDRDPAAPRLIVDQDVRLGVDDCRLDLVGPAISPDAWESTASSAARDDCR